jgi:hypothetical protein
VRGVVAAAAAKPGEDDFCSIKLEDEPAKEESAPFELETPIGKVKAVHEKIRVGSHPDDVATRTVGAEGAFHGLELGREFDHDGRKILERLARLEETKLPSASGERPCYRVTLATTIDGKPRGTGIDVWVSKTSLFFGEHCLERKEGIVDETFEQGTNGEPLFPLGSH